MLRQVCTLLVWPCLLCWQKGNFNSSPSNWDWLCLLYRHAGAVAWNLMVAGSGIVVLKVNINRFTLANVRQEVKLIWCCESP